MSAYCLNCDDPCNPELKWCPKCEAVILERDPKRDPYRTVPKIKKRKKKKPRSVLIHSPLLGSSLRVT